MADDTAPTHTNARPNLPMYLDVGGLIEFIDDMMADTFVICIEKET